jgi:uncharacterized protein YggL (DUF469 family)
MLFLGGAGYALMKQEMVNKVIIIQKKKKKERVRDFQSLILKIRLSFSSRTRSADPHTHMLYAMVVVAQSASRYVIGCF